jgi:hypothetical protein
MIRRGFWLTAGALTGIYGYRRVSAAGRRLSGTLNLTGPGAGPLAGPGAPGRLNRRRPGAVALARETLRFTRDVREGMELYMVRHSGPAGPTLSTEHDVRPKQSEQSEQPEHPEDGH